MGTLRTRTKTLSLSPTSLLLLLVLALAADAAHNLTVDDTDNVSILYDPADSWRETPADPLSVGGSHAVTSDVSATATFEFTGIAIYFYAPLFPFELTTALSLDGAPPVLIDLLDPAQGTLTPSGPSPGVAASTVQSQIVWQMDGLDYTEHTLVISVGAGQDRAIVDALMYTVPDPGDPSTTSSSTPTSSDTTSPDPTASSASSASSSFSLLPPPTSTPSPSSATALSPGTKKGLSIALGIVCTVFGLLVLYALRWWWRRRQRRIEEKREAEAYARASPGPGGWGSASPPEMAESAGGVGAGAGAGAAGVGAYAYSSRLQGIQPQSQSHIPPQLPWPRPRLNRVPVPPVSVSPTPAPPPIPKRRRSAPRRPVGSSPLASQSPVTAGNANATNTNTNTKTRRELSTIPELRMERDSTVGSSPSSAYNKSGDTTLRPTGQNGNGNGVHDDTPLELEPPWTEVEPHSDSVTDSLGTATGTSGSDSNGYGYGWTTFDSHGQERGPGLGSGLGTR